MEYEMAVMMAVEMDYKWVGWMVFAKVALTVEKSDQPMAVMRVVEMVSRKVASTVEMMADELVVVKVS